MELILLIIQIVIAIFLILSVLVQRSDSDGFGLGSSSGGGLMSGRGQANLMTRTTAILAFLFMANSLLLGTITARSGSSGLIDEVVSQQEPFTAPRDGDASVGLQDVGAPDETGEAATTTDIVPDSEASPAADESNTTTAPAGDEEAPQQTPEISAPVAE